jgi:hypothetical protein
MSTALAPVARARQTVQRRRRRQPHDAESRCTAPRRGRGRVVINAVGRVGDHKVRRDATEHALNGGRHCAVAAEQAMAAEPP